MKKLLLPIAALAVLVAAGAACAHAWRGHVLARERHAELAEADRLARGEQWRETLALLQSLYRQGAARDPATLEHLRRLEFEASTALGDSPRLLNLYRQEPVLFRHDETASLAVARILLSRQESDAARDLRDLWRGRETQPAPWLFLDADLLLTQGRAREASRLLENASFPGKADAGRLLRLALAHADDGPVSMKYLDQAYDADPGNADLRSIRAHLFEARGQIAQAHVEYAAAQAIAPANPLLRDQLAEFYRRQGDYPLALKTWREGLDASGLDSTLLKVAFWSRVARPATWPETGAVPTGMLTPLADYIHALPAGGFWNETAFGRLRFSDNYVRLRQEVFWLRLLDQLQNGHEQAALDMLQNDPFRSQSVQPELESSLKIILRFRLVKIAPAPGDFVPGSGPRHPFFEQLKDWSEGQPASADLLAFCHGPYALAGAVLAAGWDEALVHLVPTDHPLPDAPGWFLAGLSRALQNVSDAKTALAFARQQPATPDLQVALGQLLLALGQIPEARDVLTPIAGTADDPGSSAAQLLAGQAIQDKDYAAARQWIAGNAVLAASLPGREMVARITLLEGNEAEAARLYTDLGPDSVEGQAYLARKAYAENRFEEARRITAGLLARYPDDLGLRHNLKLLDTAEPH